MPFMPGRFRTVLTVFPATLILFVVAVSAGAPDRHTADWRQAAVPVADSLRR
jgi:hypothetical protein